MRTREEALSYGLSFPDTYQDAPFHDTKLLEADGIEVADGRVDLARYQWELLDTMSRS